jgi:hypothetical protein
MLSCAAPERSLVELLDPLFGDLDRRPIAAEEGQWVTQVVGIHRTSREAWVQIATSRDDDETVLLRFVPGAKTDTALKALETWSGMSLLQRPHIVDVPRVM